MYTAKTPRIVKALYRDLVWKISTPDPVLFLTFDDGPVPEVTPKVLEILKQYNAKATFFCIGDNVKKHPEIYRQILEEGHRTGNHSFNHLNGWKTKNAVYYRNIFKCSEEVNSALFRPPYGKITRSQSAKLKNRFSIIMWDVLSGDFDRSATKEKCLQNVIQSASPGSIIVFHDSIKAADKMLYALPKVLSHYSSIGFSFPALPERIPVK
ncbi:MAG: polysaccharide deacetylase family protein [Bacteroidota bacterium]